MSSNQDVRAISQPATVIRQKQKKTLAGKHSTVSKICAQIPGDGRRTIQMVTRTNFYEQYGKITAGIEKGGKQMDHLCSPFFYFKS